jgi:metal-responsive CopG/Arc/MetJ family transcriptional regulator
MKIAVSMPDDVFRRLEREARRCRISRSELLTRAAREFLDEQRGRDVTESYDRAFADHATEAEDDTDRLRRRATRRALLAVEWK